MKAIERWFNTGKNWAVGVSIYSALGKDEKLKKLFSIGPTPFAKKKLEHALREITAFIKTPTDNNAGLSAKRTSTDINREVTGMPDSEDNILQAIKNEWLVPYMEMNFIRHKMFSIDGNSTKAITARKNMAFKVLELEQQCIKIWAKRDYYLKHGQLPDASEKKVEIPSDPLELGKFVENCKKNIRRNRKLMADKPQVPDYAANYNHYRALFKQATGKDYIEKYSHAKEPKS